MLSSFGVKCFIRGPCGIPPCGREWHIVWGAGPYWGDALGASKIIGVGEILPRIAFPANIDAVGFERSRRQKSQFLRWRLRDCFIYFPGTDQRQTRWGGGGGECVCVGPLPVVGRGPSKELQDAGASDCATLLSAKPYGAATTVLSIGVRPVLTHRLRGGEV